jgi:hypothetical protein
MSISNRVFEVKQTPGQETPGRAVARGDFVFAAHRAKELAPWRRMRHVTSPIRSHGEQAARSRRKQGDNIEGWGRRREIDRRKGDLNVLEVRHALLICVEADVSGRLHEDPPDGKTDDAAGAKLLVA